MSSPTHSARLSKRGAVGFVITADEDATGAATGTISLVNPARTVHFVKRRIALRGDGRTTVKLRLASAGATLVRRALARHAALKARVTLSVADAAGNQSTTRLVLRLRR